MIIDLALSKNYIRDWTALNGIRELTQNCIDEGAEKIIYENGNIELINYDTKISIDKLALGETSKYNDKGKIGKFGEGFKLGLLVLIRNGYDVEIINDNEIWRPFLAMSDIFGVETLHVEITELEYSEEKVSFTIKNCEDLIGELVMENLVIREAIGGMELDETNTYYGKLIRGNEFKGRIYVGGLYVQSDSHFKYGFDFNPDCVQLDRDRKAINIYTLRSLIAKLITETNEPKIIYESIKQDDISDNVIENIHRVSDDAKKEIIDLYSKDKKIDIEKPIVLISGEINEYLKTTNKILPYGTKVEDEEEIRNLFNETMNTTQNYEELSDEYEKWNETKNTLPSMLERFNASDYKKALALFNAKKKFFNREEKEFFQKIILPKCRNYDFNKVLEYLDLDTVTYENVSVDDLMQ